MHTFKVFAFEGTTPLGVSQVVANTVSEVITKLVRNADGVNFKRAADGRVVINRGTKSMVVVG